MQLQASSLWLRSRRGLGTAASLFSSCAKFGQLEITIDFPRGENLQRAANAERLIGGSGRASPKGRLSGAIGRDRVLQMPGIIPIQTLRNL
jgi:hypothetical protein